MLGRNYNLLERWRGRRRWGAGKGGLPIEDHGGMKCQSSYAVDVKKEVLAICCLRMTTASTGTRKGMGRGDGDDWTYR
jgi:hypothetical protein